MKSIVYFILLFVPIAVLAQSEPTKKDRASIEVLGNCEMCKMRIEKAAFSVKGVKYASWDIPSGQLSLIYNGLKTNTNVIAKQIAAAGHDTAQHQSNEEVYNELPACCQYVRNGEEPKAGQMMKH